jgi:hypothetical protein
VLVLTAILAVVTFLAVSGRVGDSATGRPDVVAFD